MPAVELAMANVRAAALTNFEQVARFAGVDPRPLLEAAGLHAPVTAQPDRPLPVATVADLLEEAARRSGCEQFGLLMAESRSLASIGPVSLVLLHQPRAGDVIRAMIRYQHLFGHAIHISCEDMDDAMLVRIELAEVPLARQGIELAVAFFCRCVAAVIGRNWSPESVHFVHPAPRSLTAHRRVFSCPVHFESAFNGIVCAGEAMREENPASDRQRAAQAERMLALLVPKADDPSRAEIVRRFLRLLLPDQRGSIEAVARTMGMSVRTLQRALAREGRSFGELLDDVRRELATRYLAASHSIEDVAALTGYDRASSFTRWFTAAFGLPPAQWRRLGPDDRVAGPAGSG